MSARTSLQGLSSTIPSLTALADPPVRAIDGAAMDYFLAELVPAIRASAAVAVARTRAVEKEMVDAGLLPAPLPSSAQGASNRDSVASTGSRPDAKGPVDEDEEAVRLRLESIGVHIGANVAER
jgi:trafficking protein particle complex subunit 6